MNRPSWSQFFPTRPYYEDDWIPAPTRDNGRHHMMAERLQSAATNDQERVGQF